MLPLEIPISAFIDCCCILNILVTSLIRSAHLGRDAEAHDAAARVLEIDPAFTISAYIARGGQSNAKLFIEGLRKEGVARIARRAVRTRRSNDRFRRNIAAPDVCDGTSAVGEKPTPHSKAHPFSRLNLA